MGVRQNANEINHLVGGCPSADVGVGGGGAREPGQPRERDQLQLLHTKCGKMKRFFKIVFVVCCKYSNTPKCKKMLGAREWSLICNPKLSKRKLTSQCCREGCTLPQIMSQCYRRR